MSMHTETDAAENTDKKIWQENPDDAYSPTIHVTQHGGIGINVGGYVMVKPVREWHRVGLAHDSLVAALGAARRLGNVGYLQGEADIQGREKCGDRMFCKREEIEAQIDAALELAKGDKAAGKERL